MVSVHGIGDVLGEAVGIAGAFGGLRIHLRRLVAILAFRRFFAGRRVCLTGGPFRLGLCSRNLPDVCWSFGFLGFCSTSLRHFCGLLQVRHSRQVTDADIPFKT